MEPPLPFERAERIADELAAIAERDLFLVRTVAELERCVAGEEVGAILHLEGAEPVEPGLGNLEAWDERGLRSLGIVWSRPNAFGHGVPFRFPGTPDTGPGLTPAGRELVRACNELGVMIDVAHLNEAGFRDVARLSDRPVVSTHSGVHALCPIPRSLTDDQLDAIRDSGGLAAIVFDTPMTRGGRRPRRRHAARHDPRPRRLRRRADRRRARRARLRLRRRPSSQRARRRHEGAGAPRRARGARLERRRPTGPRSSELAACARRHLAVAPARRTPAGRRARRRRARASRRSDRPRQRLAQDDRAERDRDDRVHVRVGRHPAERRVVEQPDVRRVADERAERDEVDPADDRARRELGGCGFVTARPIGSRIAPPTSISIVVAANKSSGMRRRLERNDPVAHITDEQRTSSNAQNGAPPVGRTSSASPAKPTTTPPIATRGGRSPVAVRMSTIQSGTAPMISADSPVGTCRSATKSTALAPGSSAPTITQETSCAASRAARARRAATR